MFFYQLTVPPEGQEQFFQEYAAVPALLTQGAGYTGLMTSMFLHGGWMHLLGNMMYLWIFGDNIEAKIGNLPFLGFYLLGGLAAAAGQIFPDPGSSVPMIGASGAIAAVMGAYVVMFPHSKIKMLFLLFFSVFYKTPWTFLVFYFFQQITSGFTSLGVGGEGGGVAWWAHIGGFVFGLIWGFMFRGTDETLEQGPVV